MPVCAPPPAGSGGSGAASEARDLYVGGLPVAQASTPEAVEMGPRLTGLLTGLGCTGIVHVLPTPARGFAFVKFASGVDCRTALGLCVKHGLEYGAGVKLRVSLAKP
mmetsp:Transcript_42696/g.96637  ORF Transcript_42696/g.96637 Transcript_42696/m.96637 type:complete len:107 (+) Transcript_42696:3-323(+)